MNTINRLEIFFLDILRIIRFFVKNKFTKISPDYKHNTKVLRICGNGSSLSKNSFSEDLDGFNYMVVNRHVLSPNYIEIKPKYYVLVDSHFFKTEEGASIIKRINDTTTWHLKLFVPYGYRIDNIITNNLISVIHFSTEEFNVTNQLKYKIYDATMAMCHINNVINAAIILGVWLGYKQIELYGVEHSWTKCLFVDKQNNVCLYNSHFYDQKDVGYKTFSQIQDGEPYTLDKCLMEYAKMFASYREINKYAIYKKCKIINCTVDSFIDAFKKVY